MIDLYIHKYTSYINFWLDTVANFITLRPHNNLFCYTIPILLYFYYELEYFKGIGSHCCIGRSLQK